ncbi:hypothetical protein K8B33_05725 [Alcanivorax sp. JB21]|uniref:hypothetical protein n=1 Tax=Alcanivorax limicola TaxID=2874102 RepID=UPI001CC149F1|nr:hypothetical protein [Alcanivorax limicola]MBZ2188585.1 hypothetical protein [Alcanivorax limicola]
MDDNAMPDSHDQNFKNLILDYPRQALELFAPDEAAHLGEEVTFTPIREEQLKDRLSDRFLELDIPLLLEWPDGHREALLFVVEHHTDPSSFSVHKLARYSLSLAELFHTDRVVPVVIFLKRPRKVPDRIVLGNEFFSYLQFRYIRCVLPELPGEHHMESPNLVARLNLPNMRWPPELKLAIYASAVRGLESLEGNPDKQAKYLGFIDIYARIDNNERMLFEQIYQKEAATMTGFVERYEAIGKEKGLQEGLEQGMEKGLEKGLEQGQREARLATALNLVRKTPMDDATIADLTGLSEAEIQALREEDAKRY